MGQDPHAVSGFESQRDGAALTLNPCVAAAKFVLGKNASQKDVMPAASSIALEIVACVKTRGVLQ